MPGPRSLLLGWGGVAVPTSAAAFPPYYLAVGGAPSLVVCAGAVVFLTYSVPQMALSLAALPLVLPLS